MIKFLVVIIIAIGLMVFTAPGQKLTASILGKVSPVAQEKQLLTELQKNIDGISVTINQQEFQKLSDDEKLKQLNTLIQQAKDQVQAVQGAITQGDFSATANMLIQKVTSIQTGNQSTASLSPSQSNCPNQ